MAKTIGAKDKRPRHTTPLEVKRGYLTDDFNRLVKECYELMLDGQRMGNDIWEYRRVRYLANLLGIEIGSPVKYIRANGDKAVKSTRPPELVDKYGRLAPYYGPNEAVNRKEVEEWYKENGGK